MTALLKIANLSLMLSWFLVAGEFLPKSGQAFLVLYELSMRRYKMQGRTDYQAAELSNKYLLKYIHAALDSAKNAKIMPPYQQQALLRAENPW